MTTCVPSLRKVSGALLASTLLLACNGWGVAVVQHSGAGGGAAGAASDLGGSAGGQGGASLGTGGAGGNGAAGGDAGRGGAGGGSSSSSSAGGVGGEDALLTGSTSSGDGVVGGGGQGGAGGPASTSAGGAGGTSSGESTRMGGGMVGQGGAPIDLGAGGAPPSIETPVGTASCNSTLIEYPEPDGHAIHLPICTAIPYRTDPPAFGPHYGFWAAYKRYTTAIPRGFTVHDLEHGAVVISYNCGTSCDAELAQLDAFVAALEADPTCVAPLRRRIVMTPDPLLSTRFAVAAWGWALTSDCFDLPALGEFIAAHYAHGPEDTCADGLDLALPGAFPEGCGSAP